MPEACRRSQTTANSQTDLRLGRAPLLLVDVAAVEELVNERNGGAALLFVARLDDVVVMTGGE